MSGSAAECPHCACGCTGCSASRSRFSPSADQIAWANQRAERLAGRIVEARRALRRGDTGNAKAILDNDPEKVTCGPTAEGWECRDCGYHTY